MNTIGVEKPLAVVLAPEEVTVTFDRRVMQQIDLLSENGWNVILLAHNSGQREVTVEIHDNHLSLLIPRRGFTGIAPDASFPAKLGNAFGYYSDQIVKVSKNKIQGIRSKVASPKTLSASEIDKRTLIYAKALEVFNVKGVDLVLCCDLPAGEVAIELAQRNGAALWFDAHEHYSEQASLSDSQKRVLSIQEQRIVSKADRSYTVTPQLAKIMSHKFGSSDTVGFLPNSLRVTQTPEKGKLRKILGIDDKDTIILYHGGFFFDRNLDALLSGFQASTNQNLHLVMMGYGDRDKVLGNILDLNDRRVHFLSAVPSRELLEYVIDADAITIPYPAVDINTLNCFPNKLGDAIALRKPVIANRELIFLGNYIEKYDAGVSIDFSSTQQVAESLNSLDLSRLKPNWEEAEKDLGWSFHSKTFVGWLNNDFR